MNTIVASLLNKFREAVENKNMSGLLVQEYELRELLRCFDGPEEFGLEQRQAFLKLPMKHRQLIMEQEAKELKASGYGEVPD